MSRFNLCVDLILDQGLIELDSLLDTTLRRLNQGQLPLSQTVYNNKLIREGLKDWLRPGSITYVSIEGNTIHGHCRILLR